MQENRVIQVIVEGGLVQEILNVPSDIEIQVLDYDVQGMNKESLEKSPLDGQPCCITVY